MDRARWEEEYRLHEDIADREEELAFLSDYILRRKEFLDKAWIQGIPVHQITLYTENTLYDTLYVFDGERLPVLPETDFEHAGHSHWITSDGTIPDTNAPIYENISLHAVLDYHDT